MPLRVQNKHTKARFKKTKNNFVKPFAIFFIAILLVFGLYYLVNTKSFSKKSTVSDIISPKKVIPAVPKKPVITVAETQAKIETTLASTVGTYGYYVVDLKTGETFGKNEDYSFTAASSIKTSFAVYVYSKVEDGLLTLEKLWTYTSADYEGGTGTLIASAFGTKLSVARTVQLMISKSDNAATNMITRYLGRTNIQNYLNSEGISGVIVNKNMITPRAAGTILQGLYNNKYLNQANSNVIIELLKNSIVTERIVAGVPSGVPVAHKIGTGAGAISDTAIVYHTDGPYVIVVYSDKVSGETEPNRVIAEISKLVYAHFDSR